jgi:hypothetical protein
MEKEMSEGLSRPRSVDQELKDDFVHLLLKVCPNLQLGQPMSKPIELTYNGKILGIDNDASDFPLNHTDFEPVEARTFRVQLPLNEEDFSEIVLPGKYLHMYTCIIPMYDEVQKMVIGEEFTDIDPETYESRTRIVDQNLIDTYNAALIRFAISNGK